jgi:hypothetical protein
VSASTLLDELAAAGIRLSREGDDLIADVRPGAELDLYRDHITNHKPALLAELHRREEVVSAASTARDTFDRQHYDQLWVEWHTRQKEMTH